MPFVVETDVSDNAISGSLNQHNQPVAFFSKMLTKNEQHHPMWKKKLQLLWKQFVNGQNFYAVDILQ